MALVPLPEVEQWSLRAAVAPSVPRGTRKPWRMVLMEEFLFSCMCSEFRFSPIPLRNPFPDLQTRDKNCKDCCLQKKLWTKYPGVFCGGAWMTTESPDWQATPHDSNPLLRSISLAFPITLPGHQPSVRSWSCPRTRPANWLQE